MILEKEYQRKRAVEYAKKYALLRNPLFFTFEGIGGNCTNFVSQCILAGSCVMNFTPLYGWYYLSTSRRSASWTGVDFFYNFITQNTGLGPYGGEISLIDAQIGDVIQLSNGSEYYHTLIITEITDDDVLVCANTVDSLDRPLSTYNYVSLRVIKIFGVRYDTRYIIDCFESLYSPPGLEPVVPPDAEQYAPEENQQMPESEPENESEEPFIE